jgi:hypothetical protein
MERMSHNLIVRMGLIRFKPTQFVLMIIQTIFLNPTDGELNVTVESLIEKDLTI